MLRERVDVRIDVCVCVCICVCACASIGVGNASLGRPLGGSLRFRRCVLCWRCSGRWLHRIRIKNGVRFRHRCGGLRSGCRSLGRWRSRSSVHLCTCLGFGLAPGLGRGFGFALGLSTLASIGTRLLGVTRHRRSTRSVRRNCIRVCNRIRIRTHGVCSARSVSRTRSGRCSSSLGPPLHRGRRPRSSGRLRSRFRSNGGNRSGRQHVRSSVRRRRRRNREQVQRDIAHDVGNGFRRGHGRARFARRSPALGWSGGHERS